MQEVIKKVTKIQINKEFYPIRITKELCDCILEEEDTDFEEESIEEDDTDYMNSEGSFIPPLQEYFEDEEITHETEGNYEQLIQNIDNPYTLVSYPKFYPRFFLSVSACHDNSI